MIAIIGAHPDDAEIGAGGLLALRKSKAVMVSVTHGAYTGVRNEGTRSYRDAKDEMKASAKILNCDWEIWQWDLNVHVSMGLVNWIDDLIGRYKIDSIITHFLYDTHQAHREVAQAAISASRRVDNILMMEPPTGHAYQQFTPQLYVDISSVVEKKHMAIKAYTTQREKYNNEWEEILRAKEKLRGWEIGVKRAETFQVIRMVSKFA